MPKPQEPRTILFVDDDEDTLTALMRIFSAPAWRVLGATSGDAAWPHIESGIDVLVCDLRLNGESGLDLIVRAAAAPQIPRIIAISGAGTAQDGFAVASAGALAFVSKPFDATALRAVIDEVCARPPVLASVVAAQLGAHSLSDVQDLVRKTMVDQALARCHGNQGEAAFMLGLTRQRVNQILRSRS